MCVNQKVQYNHCNTNYIPELFMAYSVVDGEFLLEWCENFGKPQVWYISYVLQLAVQRHVTQFEPLI